MGEASKTKEKILDFVSAFCDQHGYSPSYREIAIGVGIKSTATISRHIHDLIQSGVLPPVEQCPRKLTLRRKTKLTAGTGEQVQRIVWRLQTAAWFVLTAISKKNGTVWSFHSPASWTQRA